MWYWKITKDCLGTEPEAVGKCGGNEATVFLDKCKHRLFRMSDGDGEVYYKGVFFYTQDEVNSEDGFSPLDDFGMPNAGCTSIEYRNPTTRTWEIL